MRIVALGAIALVVLAACQDVSAPQAANELISYGRFGDNPPPPPIDTGAVESGGTTYTVTYMLNKLGTAGWLKFNGADGAEVSPNAMIRFSQGAFSGEGSIGTRGGSTIDLSTADYDGSSFEKCDKPTTSTDEKPGTCFQLTINGNKLAPVGRGIVIGE
jgi:hypothetical protein